MRERHPLPSLELLNSLLEEQDPGILVWKTNINSRAMAGSIAGIRNKAGYILIKIGGTAYFRSRLIWKMHNKIDPLGVVDHINGTVNEDYIENLRDVTLSENSRNMGWRTGDSYICSMERVSNGGHVQRILRLNFSVWVDEDIEELNKRLHNAVAPILDDMIEKRKKRQHPPNERLW